MTFLLIALLSTIGPAPQNAAADQGHIVGTWTLNRDMSDDPGIARPAGASGGFRAPGVPGGRGGGRGGGGGRGIATTSGVSDGGDATSPLDPQYTRQVNAMLLEALDEPGHLTIAVGDKEVTFTDADGKVQRFKTDNSKQKVQLNSGTAETKVKWDRGKLVKETSLLGLATVKEFFSTDASGNLQVDVRVERVRVQDPFLFRLVYARETVK